jgi:hypothetical protein
MTPGAVQMLTKGYAIVFTPNTPPLKLKRFAPQEFNFATQMKPPARRLLKVDDSLVKACQQAKEKPAWADTAQPGGERAQREREVDDKDRAPKKAQEEPEKEPAKETGDKKDERDDRSYNEYGDRMPRF